MQPITPCLWFPGNAEEAVDFYVSIFKDGRIIDVARYSETGREFHQQEPGSVMTIGFELNGQRFTALNGPPIFKFSEAISLIVHCDSQEELDYYWDRLSAGGDPAAQQCGWLKDRFGLSWQITPTILPELMKGGESQSTRVMTALLQMRKLDIAQLQQAATAK